MRTMIHRSATEASSAVKDVIKKVYKYFDLETLENKPVEKEIPFSEATTIEEAMGRINNDPNTILKAINQLLRADALAKAEGEVIALGGKRSVVLSIMKPFRSMPPFNSYFQLDSEGKKILRTRKTRSGESVTEPAMDKERQDKEILAMLKANPAMLESIKQASLEAIGKDEEEEEENA